MLGARRKAATTERRRGAAVPEGHAACRRRDDPGGDADAATRGRREMRMRQNTECGAFESGEGARVWKRCRAVLGGNSVSQFYQRPNSGIRDPKIPIPNSTLQYQLPNATKVKVYLY
jgi:hypothetical protein